MTIAVAVHKNGHTVIAADSLVNFGGQRFTGDNCAFHKIHRVGDSIMVWAGWSLYAEMLTAHLSKHPPEALESEADVFAFFVTFWRAMRDEYTMTDKGRNDSHPFADLDSVFLLANRFGIFRVASDLDVTQFQQYCAVGSGAKYSMGALHVLYDLIDDPAEIARRAVQVGIDSDVYCGGPVDIAFVP
jgi:ATP-dependent protease HslVU (ClpYQ) peptidase subunit